MLSYPVTAQICRPVASVTLDTGWSVIRPVYWSGGVNGHFRSYGKVVSAAVGADILASFTSGRARACVALRRVDQKAAGRVRRRIREPVKQPPGGPRLKRDWTGTCPGRR